MCTKFRQYHTILEIRGGTDKEGNVVASLKDLAYSYIKSESAEDLETNRTALCNQLKKGAKEYIENNWRQKEPRVVRCHTRLNFNLGCHSSQRSESYHVVLKQMTNGQLSLENSAKMLAQTVNKLIRDMESEKDNEITSYPRLAQQPAFRYLRMSVTKLALTKIALEWDDLCLSAPQQPPEIRQCECPLLLQFGLPCKHYLLHYYLMGQAIPRSLCHPRWWLNPGPIQLASWAPYTEYTPTSFSQPQPLFTTAERQLLQLREELDSENRHRFDRQRARKHELVDEQMVELGARRLQLQGIPVNQPDPVPKRSWAKAKSHGRADARSLTANELAERRQRQDAREQAEQNRVAMTEELFIEELQQYASQDPFDSQLSTITVAPRRQITERPSTPPPPPPLALPIRTPTTAERPRPRRTPSPDASPLQASAYELPTSTAPPRLGREKRRRVHTKRYEESKAAGEIAESQEVHKADEQG
jgi:hypothetical protein